MEQKYDELTDSWIDDPSEDGQETAQESAQESAQERVQEKPKDKENVDDLIKPEKVTRLNKKLIIIFFAVIVLVFMVIRFIPSANEKSETDEMPLASEIATPDFGNYADRAYQENSIYPEPSYERIEDVNVSTYQPTQPYQQTQVYQPTQTYQPQQSSGVADTTTAARNAPIAAGLSWLTVSQNQSAQNNPLAALSGFTNPMNAAMSADEYMNSRLSSLGSVAGLGTSSSGNNNEPNTYEVQNMQGNKQAFYSTNRDNMITGTVLAPDTIWEGTIIPAVLITGINTDMPGQIKAMTTENIYDSQTGSTLLIPQGTTLIAEYNSSVSYSQKRVQIAWNTLIRPDGFRLDLGNMTGVDAQGYAGVKGWVNDHFFEYVKAIGIIAAFSAINGEFASSMNLTDNTSAQNIMSATQGAVNELGTKLIDRALDVQPTISIKNGTTVSIFINKTLALPPLVTPPVTSKYER